MNDLEGSSQSGLVWHPAGRKSGLSRMWIIGVTLHVAHQPNCGTFVEKQYVLLLLIVSEIFLKYLHIIFF